MTSRGWDDVIFYWAKDNLWLLLDRHGLQLIEDGAVEVKFKLLEETIYLRIEADGILACDATETRMFWHLKKQL